jgi:hypothetical protein
MRKQEGASLLFLMLVVALAVLVAVWMALPWFTAMRKEQVEKDVNRGVVPTARVKPSEAAARERALMAEFVETHGGYQALVGTEHYRVLGPRCRELVDAYVGLIDKPADAAADNVALRANVARIERSFEAECADVAAAPAAEASSGSQAELKRLGSNLDAYRALSPECRSHVDTFVGLFGQPGLTPGDRERIAEADRLFTAQCVARPAEAKADASASVNAERPAVQVDDGRQAACAQQREEADRLRAVVALTLGEEPPAPGAIDEDKRERHESLGANQSRLATLDAAVAAHCP